MLADAGLADPSLWSQFGPFGICFVILAAIIGWLLKERVRLTKAIADAETRERSLYDRIIAQGEHFVPVLERNTRALEQAEARK